MKRLSRHSGKVGLEIWKNVSNRKDVQSRDEPDLVTDGIELRERWPVISLRTKPTLVGLEGPVCLLHARLAFSLAHYAVSHRPSFNSPASQAHPFQPSPRPSQNLPSPALRPSPSFLHCRTHQHLEWSVYFLPPYFLPSPPDWL